MKKTNEQGYALFAVIVLMIVSILVAGGALNLTSASARTSHATTLRSQRYYESEKGVSHAVAWLRQNSQKLVTPFRREEFYSRFERSAPSNGANDSGLFPVQTRVKIKNSSDSAILVSDASLATAAFPPTKDITNGQVFDAIGSFAGASVGDSLVRITLVDAVADLPAQDFGPPPNPTPETDFYPVYRIDAMTKSDEGTHVYASITTDLAHLYDIGIYGQDYLEIRQECDSYLSSDGSYSAGTRRANCPAGSNSTSEVHKSEAVYGSLRTNGSINAEPPFGGDVCADFTAGCPNEGETCTGEDCGVPLLEFFDPWASYCPTNQGDLVVSGTVTLNVSGDDPSQRCWNTVTVQNNSTLKLVTTNYRYFFKTLTLQNNSNSRVSIEPNPLSGRVEMWVETITGDKFNGNQLFNANNNPTNFSLFYLGSNPLVLDGTAQMRGTLVAPNAAVTVSGSFDYCGALLAKQLLLTGSGGIHYDESLGNFGMITDIQYGLRELVQHYR